MEYTVKALADLAGVTPRTLRWYDQKGLLKPRRTTEAGYRLYGREEVERLQTILFYKELGLELETILELLNAPDFNRLAVLQSHLAALEARRKRLDALILTVRKTIDETQGGAHMSDKEVERTNASVLSLTEEEYGEWKALGEEILSALPAAVRAKADPAGDEGQRIARLHRRWLSYSWEAYSPQAHRGLGELYTADGRFTAYYDREVPGCAAFLRDAIRAYTD